MASPFDVTVTLPATAGRVLVPFGLTTPQAVAVGCAVTGASLRAVAEAHSGQTALVVTPEDDIVTLTYSYTPGEGAYPDAMFRPHPSRYTRAAEALVAEAQAAAGTGPEPERARRLACWTAEQFTYGHPEERFTDGLDHVPFLGCGLTAGSCVDINTYFLAALRGAGIEAGYVTGFFFPAEKGDWCEDNHCWVVTRHGSEVLEWDIAHYLKMGTRDIHPALNPKPGFRAALFHSMGLDFPDLAIADLKLLGQPAALGPGGRAVPVDGDFRLHHPHVKPGPLRPPQESLA